MNIEIPISSNGDDILRLDFFKTDDRWSHRLSLVSATGSVVLLSSVEGTPADVYPPSPPVQDINHHDLPTGPAVLGVGMAGQGHWSVSFSVEDQPAGPVIKADLACLQKKIDCSQAWLGSTYAIGESVAVAETSSGLILSIGDKRVSLLAGTSFSMPNLLTDRRLTIEPTEPSRDKTIPSRWLFTIQAE